jgi:soluble lytic murein transglycosylase-like protein
VSARAFALVFVGACVAILAYESASGSVPLNFDGAESDDSSADDSGTDDSVSLSFDTFPEWVGEQMNTAKNIAADASAALWGTKYDSIIANSADANGIPRDVLYNLLKTESHFREDIITGKVRSRVGALGIAQFMPATAAQELGSVDAALDPNIAIPGAARYLAKLIAQCGGSIPLGVAAYNWGVGNVLRKGIDAAPKETQQYVASVAGNYLG